MASALPPAEIRVTPADALRDRAPIRVPALGPTVNQQGYYVGRVRGNLYWITGRTCQSAFLTTSDGVVLFDGLPASVTTSSWPSMDRRRQGRQQQGDVSHLFAPRQSRRRVIAVQPDQYPHRARGDAEGYRSATTTRRGPHKSTCRVATRRTIPLTRTYDANCPLHERGDADSERRRELGVS